MKLIDLDAGIAPMIDENRKATVGEFLGIFFEQLPPTIDAIPVEWISQYMNAAYGRVRAEIIREMLDAWMEQEAQDG